MDMQLRAKKGGSEGGLKWEEDASRLVSIQDSQINGRSTSQQIEPVHKRPKEVSVKISDLVNLKAGKLTDPYTPS